MKIDDTAARKSVKALFKHEQSKQSEECVAVWLMINTFNEISIARSFPKRIPLRHSLQTPATRRCLFTRDPQKTYKDLLLSKKIKGVHKLIGISKLRKEYRSPEARQQLLKDYDVFLTDDRITHLLPKTIGKEFYKKRKEPIPIDLKKPELQKEILHAVCSAYMNFTTGNCYALKIATTSLNADQAFENIIGALPDIVKAIPGGEDNIRSLDIKTSTSTSMPIYNAGNKDDDADQETENGSDDDEDEE